VRRYWRIYRTFFVSSFARELEFRANFFAKILQSIVWIAFFVLILLVIYGNTDSVAGWSRADSFILAATIFIMTSISAAFFMSLMEIPQQVRQGTLDFVITKPIDTQFWISTRRFNFDQIGNLLAGIALLIFGLAQTHITPSANQWLAYVLLVAASLAIYYSFCLILMTTGVWLVRVDNLWVLTESATQVARFPMDIYELGLRRLLTFVVPLGFIATVPSSQLVRQVQWNMVAMGLTWALVALLASRWFWRFALRHYTSASS